MTQSYISRQYFELSSATTEGTLRDNLLLEVTVRPDLEKDPVSDAVGDSYIVTVRDVDAVNDVHVEKKSLTTDGKLDDERPDSNECSLRSYQVSIPLTDIKGSSDSFSRSFRLNIVAKDQYEEESTRLFDVLFGQMEPQWTLVNVFESMAASSLSPKVPQSLTSWRARVAPDQRVLQAYSGTRQETSLDDRHIIAPIPGRISSVFVSTGDRVEIGQPLIGLEAMKMENILKSAQAGVVAEVCVSVDQRVDSGVVLMMLDE